MRTIKFRCYDTVNNKWLWTGFENHVSETFEDKPHDVRKGNFWLTPTWTENAGQVVWQQFTGLKDTAGKEIYEGDIVKWEKQFFDHDKPEGEDVFYKELRSEVEYSGHGFWIKEEGFGWEGEGLWNWNQLEVIGNIYENPELLQQPAQQ